MIAPMVAVEVSMPVPMVDVGVMDVSVLQNVMPVRMAVRFSGRIIRSVPVPVVFVMRVQVVVRQRLMDVFVLVPFGQMEPHAQAHKGSCPEK